MLQWTRIISLSKSLCNILLFQTMLYDNNIVFFIFQVFTAATNVLKMILTEYVVTHKVSKGDTATSVEKTLPHLLAKTGDTVSDIVVF